MGTGVWVLGDQLHPQQAALAVVPPPASVLLIESHDWVEQRNYHQQKLVLVWSAMRHFAQTLQQQGYTVTYSEANTFRDPLLTWIQTHNLTRVVIMTPADRPMRQHIQDIWVGIPAELVWIENNHFLWSGRAFIDWAQKRKRLLMEDFYRLSRRKFTILMDGDQPLGGRWNFDHDNRKTPPPGTVFPPPLTFAPDALTQQVIKKVKISYAHHYGRLDTFGWAVTREDALMVLADFVEHRLPYFGPYEDAMVTSESTLWHSRLSPYLNLGLLSPQEVLEAALAQHHQQPIPLGSLEGFLRQILGWREYMRGLYEFLMPTGYADKNYFQHTHPLPDFFWTGETDMACLREVLSQVHTSGYAHHIQRLMVLSNFALISGITPAAVENWFHAVFIDAYDWVMQTNVIGMGLFADGGILASKPYAASANYIHKMSDYCQKCRYNHQDKVGQHACPFNFFYWDFLLRHRQILAASGRMGLVLSHLDRLDASTIEQIQAQSRTWWQQQTSSSHSD